MRREQTGALHDVFVLESRPWVQVVPVTAEGNLVLVRQYRHGSESWHWELPGGLVEADEAPELAAARELREETGYSADSLHPLAVLHANPAIQDNKLHLFEARNCRLQGAQELDAMEDLQVSEVPLRQALDWVRDGQLTHSMMVAALLLFASKRA